jgi:hypothetical protein
MVGDSRWTYAELAKGLGKNWLANELKEVGGDDSSCTVDFD